MLHVMARNKTPVIVRSRLDSSLKVLAARKFVFVAFVLVASSVLLAQATDPKPTGVNDPALDARVESILQKMTLEEKVGQLVQYSAGQPTGPGTGRTDYEDMIAHGQIGSLFNVVDAHQINAYQHIAMDKSR